MSETASDISGPRGSTALPSSVVKLPAQRNKPLLHGLRELKLPIYRTSWLNRATDTRYTSFTIKWTDVYGRARREKRSDLKAAKDRAEVIAGQILSGRALVANLRPEDPARLLNLDRMAAELGVSAEALLAEAVAAKKIAGVRPLSECARFAVEHLPKMVAPLNVPKLVEALLADKRRLGKGEKWLGTLEQQLVRFGSRFDCPLHVLSAHEISGWLDSLKGPKGEAIGLRTRKNYRDAVRELVRYAQAKGQLSKSWSELDRVEDAAVPPVEVEIYNEAQLLKLLVARVEIEGDRRATGTAMPFILLQAFAGVRHEEMVQRGNTKPVLDWSCIDFDRGLIRIKATVGKTKRLRLIHMHPNLIEWLRPYAKRSGPVCELTQIAGMLDRTKKRAGLPSGRGESSNVLRSSFLSHRFAETNDIGLVAREGGNSPQVIARNYLELASAADAERYFSLRPVRADILPLFAWGAR